MTRKGSSNSWLGIAITLIVSSFCNFAAAEIPREQRDALDAIFGNSPSQKIPYKLWEGTLEFDDDDNVVGLILLDGHHDNSAIYQLPFLERLHIESTLDVPSYFDLNSEIAKLPRLEQLFSHGVVGGELPIELFDLANLRTLSIEPSELLDFQSDIDDPIIRESLGGVTGTLSEDIGKLINLETLELVGLGGGRGLTGEIPTSLGKLKKLKRLDLSNNQLQGEIPNELTELTVLEYIDLSWNLLGGEVPTSLLPLPLSPSLLWQDYRYNAFYFGDITPIDRATADALGLGRDFQLRDAKVVEVSAGEHSNIYVGWQNYDWDTGVSVDINTVVAANTAQINNLSFFGSEVEFDYNFGYAIYVEKVQGDYVKVAEINDIESTSWQGDISGVELAVPLQVQVRRTRRMDWQLNSRTTMEISESTGPVNRMRVVNEHVNKAPEFLNIGDVVIDNMGEPLVIPGWASNLNDNNGGSQHLRFELKAMSNPYQNDPTVDVLKPVAYPHVSVPSGTLRFTPAAHAYGESLVVFQLCDDGTGTEGNGKCSEDAVFTIKASDERARDHASFVEMPFFNMQKELNIGLNYEFQEHLSWVNGIVLGDYDEAVFPRFHTVWVTNSDLFSVQPWVSYPSGTLRFQFKSGASGRSEVYISLEKYVGKSIYSDINKVVLVAGSDGAPIGVETTEDPAEDTILVEPGVVTQAADSQLSSAKSSAQGGGGGLSWLFFVLAYFTRQGRHIKNF